MPTCLKSPCRTCGELITIELPPDWNPYDYDNWEGLFMDGKRFYDCKDLNKARVRHTYCKEPKKTIDNL